MRLREPASHQPMVVATVPPRVPVLHADDLPGNDDWTLLTSLRVDREESFEHDLQYDRHGSLTLASVALD